MKTITPLASLLGAAVVGGVHCGAAPAISKQPPNILMILADDARFDEFGYAGNKIIQTPNIDKLAARGVVFNNAYVTTAICVVSRASIFTGQHARAHGIWNFADPVGHERWQRTYPHLLRASGYYTGMIGKFGIGRKPEHLPSDDFDFWRSRPGNLSYFDKSSPEHLTKRIGDQALEFLSTAPANKPWCLNIGFKAPHAQDKAPREFPPDARDEKLYKDAAIAPPPTATDEAFKKLPQSVQRSEGRKRWLVRFATDEMALETTRDIYRLVTGMDREVGRILDELEKRGMLENTLIIFTSDNGFALGDRGMSDKWYMYEEGVRVPLVIVPPRGAAKSASKRIDDMTLNIDFAPTMLDYAGVKIPEKMQGVSLRPLLEKKKRGKTPAWRTEFFYEHRTLPKMIPPSEGVRSGKWKYIRWTSETPVTEELFDLEADPNELNNLAGNPTMAETLQKMRERCETLKAQAGGSL
ncbi:arylsulfatase A-like enzyme [Ereboglobus sp. PH5-10]|uniref:sulfatase family protein n=1 Tax=Ereboglobus sp. PH5-10 TaxID=2940629 RepID=UPI002404C10E|nr:sulfatase [Ereboglobus sp. PH5-10]MDF9827021.1 arylsulfatase A-like enzyme [Ereboglobus sp. PH5-10]